MFIHTSRAGRYISCDIHTHLVSKAGSLISSKSPSAAFRWSGSLYNRYCTTVCCKKLCRSSNRLIYDKSAPQNIYTITGALIFDTKILFSKFILWKPFWNRTLRYHINGTLKSFSGLLPFSGRCHIPNVLRSYRITTSYNLDKIHIIGKVWVSRFHIWW